MRRGDERGDQRTYAIIGAAMEVHRHLGPGLLEPIYHEALAIDFKEREVPFQHEVAILPKYKGTILTTCYRVDFVCFDNIIVELKALDALSEREESQVINYLRASHMKLALLLNFGALSLQHRRYTNTTGKK